jgi:ABC-type antimicrobial peptide transport system permease subunit
VIANYFKAALRNMRLHKGLSFITVFGFAAGLACCILIALYAIDQLGFDRSHAKADRIYRVGIQASLNSNTFHGVISCAPLAYMVMSRWLRNFAYRSALGPDLFLVSAALALGIALFTVSFQSVRAARANPVNSLRNE